MFLGNPWPSIEGDAADTSQWINNVLLRSARKNLKPQCVTEAVEHDNILDELGSADRAEGTSV